MHLPRSRARARGGLGAARRAAGRRSVAAQAAVPAQPSDDAHARARGGEGAPGGAQELERLLKDLGGQVRGPATAGPRKTTPPCRCPTPPSRAPAPPPPKASWLGPVKPRTSACYNAAGLHVPTRTCNPAPAPAPAADR